MCKSLITVLLTLVSMTSFAQNRREADSLRTALQRAGTDTARVSTYLRLAEFQIFKPGELKTDLDSAATFLNAAQQLGRNIQLPEIAGHLAYTASKLAKERGQKEQGKTLATQAVNILQKSADQNLLGQSYLALCEYYSYDREDEINAEIKLLRQAAIAFEKTGNIERQAVVYRLLGELETPNDASLKALLHSIALYQSIHYEELQGVYDAIGARYAYITDLKPALSYQLKALKAAQQTHDTSLQLSAIYNHIGITYNKMHEFKEAIGYFENGLRVAKQYKDTGYVLTLTENICRTEYFLGHPQRMLDILHETTKTFPPSPQNVYHQVRTTIFYLTAYTRLKQFSMAARYANQLTNLADHNPTTVPRDSKIETNDALIDYYFQSKQYDKTLAYLKKNDALMKEHGQMTGIIRNYKAWYILDSARNDYKAALDHYLTYSKLRDSTYSLEKNKQIEQLKIEYDTREKESQIVLLNQKAALQQGNLHRVNLVKNVTIAGIILVLIIAILLYRQSALRKRTNKVVTDKNELITEKNELLQNLVAEKEWLLKEVHHRVKNNLHSVICLLEAQAAYLENDALEALESSQHRIYTMSLIHQKLYQSDDVKMIDMGTYIPELVQYLRDSYNTGGQIHFNMSVASIPLHAGQAIPLGLIINEALTNSIKYAFPDGRKGEINISLAEYNGAYTLELADNGVGMQAAVTTTHKHSLGMELMKGLAKEIGGSILLETTGGVKITIRFEKDFLQQADMLEDNYLASA